MMRLLSKLISRLNPLLIADWLRVKLLRMRVSSQRKPLIVQKRWLEKILKYSTKHCDFYRKLNIVLDGHDDLNKFPLIDKGLIRFEIANNRFSFVSNEINRLVHYSGKTGGSTGEPLELILSPGIDDIFQWKIWEKNGYAKGDKILAMDGAKVDESLINEHKYLYIKSRSESPYGTYGLSSLYLTEDNILEYIHLLIDFRPSFIRGYPSFIFRIANEILKMHISLPNRIKAVELTSETCFDYQISSIAQAFNSKIVLQYGHTEAIAFGYSFDESLAYRIEPLYGYVEVIKENGEKARPGELGEIVVTTLHNRAMPLIRYKTGDYAVFGKEDENGIVLKSILGRTQDYIINTNGEKVLLTALIFAQHFDALSHISRWQIEQFQPGIVVLHIIKDISFSPDDENEIRVLFERCGGVRTVFDYTDSIPLTPRGKSKMLVQHLW